jgi:glucan phosphoethanolaminetransferase (alkaline phosphatase superfamily)
LLLDGNLKILIIIGKRKLSFFIFVFAITSIFITNINFFSQPSLNLNIGFIGSYLAFSLMIISIVSIFFLKRQWILGKRLLDERDNLQKHIAKIMQTQKEYGGPEGPEPTRYGDWEKKGIVSDF